jgi:hypothetical protein
MIRQLGKPTVSVSEGTSPELLQCLSKFSKNLSLLESYSLKKNDKTILIRDDPITCVRMFHNKIKTLMTQEFYSEFYINDSYERVEFKLRGSPHEHIF